MGATDTDNMDWVKYNTHLMDLIAEANRIVEGHVNVGLSSAGRWYVNSRAEIRDGASLVMKPCFSDSPEQALTTFIEIHREALIDRTLVTK